MIEYQLNEDGTFAQRIEDGAKTGVWCNTETNQDYLDWIAGGNTPLPYEG